jgi:cytochrome c oxidase subunit I
LMLVGFGVSEWISAIGTPLLYDGSPELAVDDPRSVGFFALGYLLLSAGLAASAASGIATVLQPRLRGEADEFTSVGFALFAWAGFLVVSAIAATNAFLPGILWSLGAGPFPADHGTEWHILFHNLHYLPLMATVLVWYVLTEHLTGVKSIHGARMSKIVFAAYLVFVPPTSLYHMFLEPNLSEGVRVAGSLLSLFVSVPTLAAFAIIVSSLEASARSRGATGFFGWMRGLPWSNPAMANMGWAAVNLMLGITFAFVLIQEKLAPMLSDTFFVPGYFHFFAVGVLTQTFLAALMVILPALGGGSLWRPAVLRRMPVVVTVGLLVFGAAGIAAGFMGVPRRVFDVSYGGDGPGGLAGADGPGGRRRHHFRRRHFGHRLRRRPHLAVAVRANRGRGACGRLASRAAWRRRSSGVDWAGVGRGPGRRHVRLHHRRLPTDPVSADHRHRRRPRPLSAGEPP